MAALLAGRGESLDPKRHRDVQFVLYSVPAHASGKPELVFGRDVGSPKQRVAPGTVLLSKINPRINRVWCVAEDASSRPIIASTEWIAFPQSPVVLPAFLRYFLMREEVRRFLSENVAGVGGSLMRVTGAVVGNLTMPLPPLGEQARIVQALDEAFEEVATGEAALSRARASLTQFRASLLHAACTGALTADWRAANPGNVTADDMLADVAAWRAARGLKPILPTNHVDVTALPRLPQGWVWASLPMLGEFGRGKSKHRPRDDARLYGAAVPFIQTGEVSRSQGRIGSWAKMYSDFGVSQSKVWPAGTVCITIAANIAASGILMFDACFPDSVVGLVSPHAALARYVELFMQTARANLNAYAPATAQKNINLEILNTVAVPLPPLTEIEAIVQIVDDAQKELSGVDVDCSTLRQSILHAAFTGRLAPQDAAEEPASALLARLRASASPRRRAATIEKNPA